MVLCEDASSELARLVTLGVNRGVPAPTATPAPVTFRCETVPTPRCQNVSRAADAACQATASINNGSFDQDGDAVTVSQSPAGPFALGSTMATLTATDPSGNFNTCSAAVTVSDQTAPNFSSLTASPGNLGPPDKKMVAVQLGVGVADNCDAAVANSCRIVSVSSDDVKGKDKDKDKGRPDVQITGNLSLNLRAEKDRVYTIGVQCSDASANSATRSGASPPPTSDGRGRRRQSVSLRPPEQRRVLVVPSASSSRSTGTSGAGGVHAAQAGRAGPPSKRCWWRLRPRAPRCAA
jgi:hypothetical protein